MDQGNCKRPQLINIKAPRNKMGTELSPVAREMYLPRWPESPHGIAAPACGRSCGKQGSSRPAQPDWGSPARARPCYWNSEWRVISPAAAPKKSAHTARSSFRNKSRPDATRGRLPKPGAVSIGAAQIFAVLRVPIPLESTPFHLRSETWLPGAAWQQKVCEYATD